MAAGALLVVPAPLLFAGEPAWSIQLIACVAILALAFLVYLHRRPVSVTVVSVAVFGALVWTGFQLIPFPGLWADEVVLRGRELAGLEGGAPISVAPGATREALLVAVIAAASFVAGRLVSAASGRRAALYVVGASCAAMALVAFGHEVLGATRVFGIYAPVETTPALMAPILNPNQLGGFLAFGAVIWLGLAISTANRGVALGDAAMGLLCAMGALGSGSRGAALGVALGFAFILYLSVWRFRREHSLRQRRVLIVATVIGVSLALFSVFGLTELAGDVVDGEYSKFRLIREGFGLSTYRPLLGVGRGAFEAAFASAGSASVRYTHPENIVVQWATEWGWAFSFLAAGIWVPFLLRSLRADKAYVAAAGGAVVIFVVHDMFDFALEMPGILCVFMFAAGTLVRNGGWKISVRLQVLGLAGLAACALLSGIGLGERRVAYSFERAQELELGELTEFAQSVTRDHPVDPLASLAVGTAFARHEHPHSLRWLNRTMELAPDWSAPHAVAANLLARRGALAQALVETFEAERRRAQSSGETLCWLAQSMDVEELTNVAAPRSESDRADRVRFSEQTARCLDGDKRSAFDALLIAEGGAPHALLRRARRLLRSGDSVGALVDLDAVRERDRDLGYLLLRARVVAADDPLAGLEVLHRTQGEAGSEEEWRVLSTRAELCGVAQDAELLEGTLEELRRHAAGDATRIATAWAIGGKAYRAMGQPEAAFAAYQRAHALDPSSNAYLRALAGLARAQGLRGRAAGYLRTLCQRGERNACE